MNKVELENNGMEAEVAECVEIFSDVIKGVGYVGSEKQVENAERGMVY